MRLCRTPEMSSLSNTFGILFFRKYTAARYTYLKLLCIVHPRMKAFWFAETSSARCCTSRVANSLETSLPKLWIMVIGR